MNASLQNAFRLELRVADADIDALDHVNNVVYLRWVQEAAEAHWNHLNGGNPPEGLVWVVLRHELDYRLALGRDDRVHALTWVGETSGVKSVRHVVIRTADERVAAEARTTWCLIDSKTGLPKRIPPGILSMLSM